MKADVDTVVQVEELEVGEIRGQQPNLCQGYACVTQVQFLQASSALVDQRNKSSLIQFIDASQAQNF